jgi:hypothetical protein
VGLLTPDTVNTIFEPASNNPFKSAVSTSALDMETAPMEPGTAGDNRVEEDAAWHARPVPDNEITNLLSGKIALVGLRETVIVTP